MTWSFHIKIHSFMSFKICNSIFCFKQVAPYPNLSQMQNAVDEKLAWESYKEKCFRTLYGDRNNQRFLLN